MNTKNKWPFVLVLIVLLGLTLRLICFLQLMESYPYFASPLKGTDMFHSHNDAFAHLNGTFDEFPHYRNALYPYFLALIYSAFGQNILIAKAAQIFLGCINCILVYLLSKEMFNKNIGLLAAGFSACYKMFIIYNSVLLVATVLTFLITVTILMLLRIRQTASYLLTIGAGISMGLSTLARGSNILLIPPVAVWLLVVLKSRGRRKFLLPLIFLICSVSVISVASVQNYVFGGKFVPLTTNGGINFALGNCPGAEGWFRYPKWLKATPEREQRPHDDSTFWFKETLKSIHEQPREWLKLMFRKFLLFWSRDTRKIANNINEETITKHSSLLQHFPLITFGAIGPLGLAGIALSSGKWKKLSAVYMFLFVYMCSIIFIFVMARFRLPFVQMLIPFAAFTIYQGYIKLKDKNFNYICLIILLLVPSLGLTRAYNIYQEIKGRKYVRSHPHGTYALSNNTLTICDDSRKRQNWRLVVLNTDEQRVKKNLIVRIEKDLSEIKRAWLGLTYICGPEGEIVLLINEHHAFKIKCEQVYAGDELNRANIPFDPSVLIEGSNSLVLWVIKGGRLIIPIDDSYKYNRSAFSADGGSEWNYTDLSPNTKGKNKGEYMLSLLLEF